MDLRINTTSTVSSMVQSVLAAADENQMHSATAISAESIVYNGVLATYLTGRATFLAPGIMAI